MPVSGLGIEQSTRRYQGFFGRWGAKANLRGVLNYVLPVAVVDRFQGIEEGSYRAITAITDGALNEYPACFFGGISGVTTRDDVELEIVQIRVALGVDALTPPGYNLVAHMFTPIAPYNPVTNLNPVGTFLPGMMLDPAFTRGSMIGFGGSNPALSADTGFVLSAHESLTGTLSTAFYLFDLFGDRDGQLREPLRLPVGAGLAFQWKYRAVGIRTRMMASLLYRERGVLS